METVTFKAKSRAEVAEEYGINVKTLYRWIKKSNIILPKGLITPFHLQLIYNTFGIPGRHKIARVS
jgi:DNA invertase Pin-like site-specific DNA recombinase